MVFYASFHLSITVTFFTLIHRERAQAMFGFNPLFFATAWRKIDWLWSGCGGIKSVYFILIFEVMRRGDECDDEDDEDIEKMQFKVILLGDGAVGKTSIAKRFAEDQFSQIYKQTVGVDFFIRRLKLPPKYHIALQIWDIGGQSIGSRMLSNYM